jgi:hypothetical protein
MHRPLDQEVLMRSRRIIAGLGAGAVLAGTLGVAGISPASAVNPSNVTVLHGIPGATVDVYVDDALLLEDFEPKDVTDPVELAPGSYAIEVFEADANPATATPVITQDVNVPGGADISLIANLDGAGTPVLTPFVETFDDVPFGHGRVSVRHTAAAPTVDIQAGGTDVIPALAYGDESSLELPEASYDLAVQVSPDGPVALDLGRVAVPAGVQINAYAIGSAGGGTLDVLVQVVDVTEQSAITVVHGIPGLTVDVYVDDVLLLEDFAPKMTADTQLPPGDHLVEVFQAGSDPTGTPAIAETVTVPEGIAAAVVANLAGGTPDLDVFVNDVTPTVPGAGRVTVRHTAAAPTVDIQVNGSDAIPGLEAGAEATATLAAGTYDFGVQVASEGAVVLELPDVAIGPGSVSWVYAIGSAAGGTLDTIVIGAAPGQAFTDVPFDHPFVTEIQFLLDEGLANGFEDGSYQPGARMSRQALAAFLYRHAGSPGGPDPSCTVAPFTDVPVDHPFCGEIAWLEAEGLGEGYGDGSFRPGAPVSRQAVSAILYRAAGAPNGTDPVCAGAPFTDVPVDHPFCGEIAWMADSGISSGFDDGSFQPGALMSRQALAAFVYRLEMLA